MSHCLEIFNSLGPLLIRASCQTAVVAAIAFLVCALLGDRLAPRWRFALWALVLVRLLVPVLPASPASLFQVFRWQQTNSRVLEIATPAAYAPVDGRIERSLPAAEGQIASQTRMNAPSESTNPPYAVAAESSTLTRNSRRSGGLAGTSLAWFGVEESFCLRAGWRFKSTPCIVASGPGERWTTRTCWRC